MIIVLVYISNLHFYVRIIWPRKSAHHLVNLAALAFEIVQRAASLRFISRSKELDLVAEMKKRSRGLPGYRMKLKCGSYTRCLSIDSLVYYLAPLLDYIDIWQNETC